MTVTAISIQLWELGTCARSGFDVLRVRPIHSYNDEAIRAELRAEAQSAISESSVAAFAAIEVTHWTGSRRGEWQTRVRAVVSMDELRWVEALEQLACFLAEEPSGHPVFTDGPVWPPAIERRPA